MSYRQTRTYLTANGAKNTSMLINFNLDQTIGDIQEHIAKIFSKKTDEVQILDFQHQVLKSSDLVFNEYFEQGLKVYFLFKNGDVWETMDDIKPYPPLDKIVLNPESQEILEKLMEPFMEIARKAAENESNSHSH